MSTASFTPSAAPITHMIEAPMLAGSRLRAQQITDELPADLAADVVALHCGSMMAATLSFADEVVLDLLVRRRARLLVVINSSPEFAGQLLARAVVHGVDDRLRIRL